MRKDMYKVIVERPRRGGGFRSEIPAPDDPDDSPKQEGLKRRHRSRKWLNENLRPLERFLASQVGRPWDKVYAEICAGIDRRNTVQQHIHQHLQDFVAIRTVMIDGVPHAMRTWGGLEPIAGSRGPKFYVDPRTGLLRVNAARIALRREWLSEHRKSLHAQRTGLREDRRILDARTQLHRIAGVWYQVTLAPIRGHGTEIDALRHLPVAQCPRRDDGKRGAANATLFNDPDVYAVAKRQLGARELKHHGLRNLDA